MQVGPGVPVEGPQPSCCPSGPCSPRTEMPQERGLRAGLSSLKKLLRGFLWRERRQFQVFSESSSCLYRQERLGKQHLFGFELEDCKIMAL